MVLPAAIMRPYIKGICLETGCRNTGLIMSKTQWTSLIATGFYLWWEYLFLADWKAETTGPLIRVDLLIIYPVLLGLFAVSVFQYFSARKRG